MSYKSSTELERGHAKMNRAGEVQRVLDALRDPATPEQIEAKTGIPKQKLNSGMLNEMQDYGMVKRLQKAGGGRASMWARHKPTNIERLKDDMMGATA